MWIKGYSRSIGYTTSVVAEWWALRDGLTLAIQLGCQHLEVELDAKVIVELLKSNSTPNRNYSPLLHDCRMLLDQLQQVRVVHVFREANMCADFLARWGCCMQDDFVIFDQPPTVEFLPILYADMYGVSCCRLTSPSLVSVNS